MYIGSQEKLPTWKKYLNIYICQKYLLTASFSLDSSICLSAGIELAILQDKEKISLLSLCKTGECAPAKQVLMCSPCLCLEISLAHIKP